MKSFKAYDIRGVWNKDLNADDVYRIGFFLPQVLNANTVLVGRDCRISSDEVFNALCKGITDSGASLADAGLTSTPTIYWATAKFGYQASVMITASHNPKDHNGLKVSAANALPVGYDSGLNRIEKLVETATIHPVSNPGKVEKVDVKRAYVDFLTTYKREFSRLKIAMDCSNGMASLYCHPLFGDEVLYINDVADGNFPGHEPNPLEPENQQQLKEIVLKNQCDIGVVFDGDADRVMFIDEKGQFVSPDLIIALMGHYFFGEKALQGKVLQDIRSSRAISEYLSQFGAKVETWRVGRAYGAGKLREIDGVYGGELAGHYYFREFYYSDSGLLAALIVLGLLAKFQGKGVSLSQLINDISSYHNSGEINFIIGKKSEAMEAIREYFTKQQQPDSFMDFDGYRLDYPEYWLNIRPSNTEPYLRFIAEAKSKTKLNAIINEVNKIVSDFK
ncbi:MAG: phosphomannomutase/phosphoglucomutase [Bacteroidales bacterium]|nr:phosphomannomutase/phosphoglucomutase [Bacteroidales bacterium]